MSFFVTSRNVRRKRRKRRKKKERKKEKEKEEKGRKKLDHSNCLVSCKECSALRAIITLSVHRPKKCKQNALTKRDGEKHYLLT